MIGSLKKNSFTVANSGTGSAGPFTVLVKQSQGGTTRFDIAAASSPASPPPAPSTVSRAT